MRYASLAFIGLFFFYIQFALSAPFVFTDANVYLYYADQLTKGALLYKDLYMTNFPLVPYVSIIYSLLTLHSVHGFYLTASVEALLSSVVLYCIVNKLYRNSMISSIASVFYLTTFLVFSSANHQNGVLLAVLLFNAGYLSYLHKRYILSGIFLGMTLMAKAYMLPIILALFIYISIKEKNRLAAVLAGCFGSVCLLLLPTLILTPKEFIEQVFGYSLSRAAGFDKGSILLSLLINDPLVVLLLFYTLFRWRSLRFPALATVCVMIFLLFYQDLYLLYFNIFVPLAVIALGDLLATLKKQTKQVGVIVAVVSFIFIVQGFTLYRYLTSINDFMTIPDINEFTQIVKNTNPDFLYGEYGIVQGISYLSGIPMLEGTSDTNRKLFLSGVLNKEMITRKINDSKTTLILYSIGDSFNLATQSAIVDWEQLKNHCSVTHSQPFKTSIPQTKIAVVKCFAD